MAAWRRALETIGVWQTRLLMAIIYFFVIGPIAILMRLVGHDPLAGPTLEPESCYSPPRRRPPIGEYLHRLY